MAKLSFTKVENGLDKALNKMAIDRLHELATISNLLSDSKPKVPTKTTEEIFLRFLRELKKLKKQDPKLYSKLEITKEEEKRFSLSIQELTQNDWSKIKIIREKIEKLKKELNGQEISREEDEKRIEEERIKHVNKRFNVREGWLPLK